MFLISAPEGFNSYQEVKLWLSICRNIEISYPTIHRIVRYELRGKLKVPRPIHEKQKPGVIEAFKNYFPIRIKGLMNEIREKYGANRHQSLLHLCDENYRHIQFSLGAANHKKQFLDRDCNQNHHNRAILTQLQC